MSAIPGNNNLSHPADDSTDALSRTLQDRTKVIAVAGRGIHRIPDTEDYGPDMSVMPVLINGSFRTKHIRQVQWFLENGAWEDHVISECDVKDCITHIALENVISDDELLALVQKDTRVSLADLYRKGRQKGLISARSSGY